MKAAIALTRHEAAALASLVRLRTGDMEREGYAEEAALAYGELLAQLDAVAADAAREDMIGRLIVSAGREPEGGRLTLAEAKEQQPPATDEAAAAFDEAVESLRGPELLPQTEEWDRYRFPREATWPYAFKEPETLVQIVRALKGMAHEETYADLAKRVDPYTLSEGDVKRVAIEYSETLRWLTEECSRNYEFRACYAHLLHHARARQGAAKAAAA